jgi:hypothetical protein
MDYATTKEPAISFCEANSYCSSHILLILFYHLYYNRYILVWVDILRTRSIFCFPKMSVTQNITPILHTWKIKLTLCLIKLINLWLYKENNKLRDWKNIFTLHIPPWAPYTCDFVVLTSLTHSKKNSFGCAANRKIKKKAKDLSAPLRMPWR